jgi:hypothetical protein
MDQIKMIIELKIKIPLHWTVLMLEKVTATTKCVMGIDPWLKKGFQMHSSFYHTISTVKP